MKKIILILLTVLFFFTGCTKNEPEEKDFALKADNTKVTLYHREDSFSFTVEPENATGQVTYQWSIPASLIDAGNSSQDYILTEVTGSTISSKDLMLHYTAAGESASREIDVNILQLIQDPGTVFTIACTATCDGKTASQQFTVELVTDGRSNPSFKEDSSFYINLDCPKEFGYQEIIIPYHVTAKAENAKGEVQYRWYLSDNGAYGLSDPVSEKPSMILPQKTSGTEQYVCVATDGNSYWSEQFTVVYGDVIYEPTLFVNSYLGDFYSTLDNTSRVQFYHQNDKDIFHFTGLNVKGELVDFTGEVIGWLPKEMNVQVTLKVTSYAINNDPCHVENDTFEFVIYETDGFQKLSFVPLASAKDNGYIVNNIIINYKKVLP